MTKSLKPKGLIAAFIPDVNDPQTTNPRRFVVFISGFSASRPYNFTNDQGASRSAPTIFDPPNETQQILNSIILPKERSPLAKSGVLLFESWHGGLLMYHRVIRVLRLALKLARYPFLNTPNVRCSQLF